MAKKDGTTEMPLLMRFTQAARGMEQVQQGQAQRGAPAPPAARQPQPNSGVRGL